MFLFNFFNIQLDLYMDKNTEVQQKSKFQVVIVGRFQVHILRKDKALICYLLQFVEDGKGYGLNDLKMLSNCELDKVHQQLREIVGDSDQYERQVMILLLTTQQQQIINIPHKMIISGLKQLYGLMAMRNIYSQIDVFYMEKKQQVSTDVILKFVQELLWQKISTVLHGAEIFFKEEKIQKIETSLKSYTLITGGSRGIGRQTAEKFGKEGKNLILTGRPGNNELGLFGTYLVDKYNINVETMYLDLKDENNINQFTLQLQQKSIPIEAVILNAAVGTTTSLEQTSSTENQSYTILEINSIGPINLFNQLQGKKLIDKNTQIFIVSSVSALRPFNYLHQIDLISKGILDAWSQQVAKSYNVITLYPGGTDTEMFRKSTLNPMKQQNKLEQFIKSMPKSYIIKPQQIAHLIYLFCKAEYRGYFGGNQVAACCGMHIDYKPL